MKFDCELYERNLYDNRVGFNTAFYAIGWWLLTLKSHSGNLYMYTGIGDNNFVIANTNSTNRITKKVHYVPQPEVL
jgi:hypothetical protein